MTAKPKCAKCRGTNLAGPAPLRTSAHPNSSHILVETPGAHYHDHTLQGTVCLDCGAVEVGLSGPTLDRLRKELGKAPRKGARRGGAK